MAERKDIHVKISETSCVQVSPDHCDLDGPGVTVVWSRHDREVQVTTRIRLTKVAAVTTARAVLAFYDEEIEPSA